MRILILFLALFMGTAVYADNGAVKVVAVVGDQVISSVDLNDRIYLVMVTTGIPDTPENRSKLAPQILRQLVDEKLQLQDAAANGITISDEKVHQAVEQLEKQNGKPPGSLEQFIEVKGASKTSFYNQLRAQVAWVETVTKKIRPRVRVSDQEVARYYVRRKAAAASADNSHAREVKIAVIQLPVDSPKNEASVRRAADKLAEQIHSGVSFDAIAAQFSSGARGVAITPFWVEYAQLDPAIASVLAHTQKGAVTAPVKTGSGYQLIKLVDIRENAPAEKEAAAPAAPQPRAEFAFRQIIISGKPDAKNADTRKLMAVADEVARAPGKCSGKAIVSPAADADVSVSLLRRMSTSLPDKVRDILSSLSVGGISKPVATPEGVRLFMLCERVDLPPEKPAENADRPSDEAIRQAIFTEKLELEAQKYMRNLREQAFIEVHGL